VTTAQFSSERTLQPPLRTARELASIIGEEQKVKVVARPLRAIATLTSLALLACSIFAVSWVGLALLGY
jgi:hypothetical protein